MNMMSQWIEGGQIELSQEGYYPVFPTRAQRRQGRVLQLLAG
jgi:hypothetical protein